jgi:hypothetical protein
VKRIAHLVVLDDREHVGPTVAGIVGLRSYGDIIVRRKPLKTSIKALAKIDGLEVIEVTRSSRLAQILNIIEKHEDLPLTVIPGRAVSTDPLGFGEAIKRLRFLGKNFYNSEKIPLIAHFKTAKEFLKGWDRFLEGPIHLQGHDWVSETQIEASKSLSDISDLESFLKVVTQGTEARHFNDLSIDQYTCIKSSLDVDKMKAEFQYYYLLPNEMQPWFVQPYNFKVVGKMASYEMFRYHLADASVQWIHGAWSPQAFHTFLDRILTFFRERKGKNFHREEVLEQADLLFLEKVRSRSKQLKEATEGIRVLSLLESAGDSFDAIVDRYERLYFRHRRNFQADTLCIGHGDSCLSNVLYEQHHMVMKLIDPKGAHTESGLWMHPLYDVCKLSHSINGLYDFINHGLFKVTLARENSLDLILQTTDGLEELQQVFKTRIIKEGIDWRALRIGECSLFLSMPALHLDHPNKALAFLLNAKRIMDELEEHD